MFLILFPISVLLAILVGAAVFWRLRRRSPLIRATFSAAAGAGTFVLVWGVAIGAALAALFEPWPLSLRQGPDTGFARECFQRHLREAPPPGVHNLYCRNEWGFGGDSVYSLRFDFTDRELVSRLVERFQLEPVEPAARAGVRYLAAPKWWPSEDDLTQMPMIYQRRGFTFLWVDEAVGKACFQKARF